MSNRILGIVALAALTGCAGNRAELDAAKDQARSEYYACLRTAARAIDDGRADLQTVALAVKSRCGNEFEAYARAASAHLVPGYQAQFRIDIEPKQLENAATAVAENRMGTAKRP